MNVKFDAIISKTIKTRYIALGGTSPFENVARNENGNPNNIAK